MFAVIQLLGLPEPPSSQRHGQAGFGWLDRSEAPGDWPRILEVAFRAGAECRILAILGAVYHDLGVDQTEMTTWLKALMSTTRS